MKQVQTRIMLHLGVILCLLCVYSGALVPLALETEANGSFK